MSQKLIQSDKQVIKQVQKLSQQHMLQIRLLEMPLTELEETVNIELNDNPALESGNVDNTLDDDYSDFTTTDSEDNEQDPDEMSVMAERNQALDDALKGIGEDDVMKDLSGSESYRDSDVEERECGSKESFYDYLKGQMAMLVLSDKEKEIMEYLIGSLDNDGMLRDNLDTIIDELAIYNNIEVSPEDMQRLIKILQGFDPAGIGARNLRECLLLQIKRKEQNDITRLMYKVLSDYYEDFVNNHKEKICQQLNLGEEMANTLLLELKKLNPRPGVSLGETEGSKMHEVTPDFIIETDYDGSVSFVVNGGMIPELYITQEFSDLVKEYNTNKENMSRKDKEALLFAKRKIERAQGFIDAVRQRRHTLYVTMKAIIDIQKKYFTEGDESEIKPMRLKDVADRTGLDISTISRVSNLKYAETPWGIFKLRHFFSNGYVTDGGEEMSTLKIKLALQEVINQEDKKHPLNDQAICELMEKKGFAIARRTVAKYRKQLKIPVARLRKV